MPSKMRENISYFLTAQYYQWKSLFIYRLQAVIWMVYGSFSVINAYIAVTVIYNVSSGIAGWTYYQVLMLAAVTSILMNIVIYLIDAGNLIWRMRSGAIDPYLTKPYSQLMVIMSNFSNNEQLVGIVSGMALFAYAASQTYIGLQSLAGFIILFALGSVAVVLFFLALSVLAYHIFKSGMFIGRMMNLASSVGRFPLTVYGLVGQAIFSILIPVGLAYFYPSQVFFGRFSAPGFALVAAAALLLAYASRKLFYRLMRGYTSGQG